MYKTKCSKILCIIIIFFTTGCSSRQLTNPDDSLVRVKHGGSWEEEVKRLVEPLINSKKNIGVAVAIYNERHTNVFSYGYLNTVTQMPIQPDTLFGIGSATKPIIVSLLFVLSENNVVSIHDKIGDILPAYLEFRDPRIKNITLAQLASHTSGLPREPIGPKSLLSLIHYLLTGENIYKHLNQKEIYAFLEKYQLEKNIDTQSAYSNIGIGILAHCLTLKTNRDLETLLNQNVFFPLRMSDTTVSLKPEFTQKLATGHVGDQPIFLSRNTPLENWAFDSTMIGTGGVYSTANDLIEYLKANLGESGTILDKTFRNSHKIIAQNHALLLTMGWHVDYLSEYNTHLYFYHGFVSGYNCYIGFEPTTKVAVVVLRNNFNWKDSIGHNLLLRLTLNHRQPFHAKAKFKPFSFSIPK